MVDRPSKGNCAVADDSQRRRGMLLHVITSLLILVSVLGDGDSVPRGNMQQMDLALIRTQLFGILRIILRYN